MIAKKISDFLKIYIFVRNNLKKLSHIRIHFLLLSVLFISCVNAEGQWYGRVGFGYAIPMAGESLSGEGYYNGSLISTVSGANYPNSFSTKQASFTAGLQGFLAVGYHLNKNVALELTDNTGIVTKKYTYTDDETVSGGTYFTSTTQAQHVTIIIPSMVIMTDCDKWNFYARIGCALPLYSRITMTIVNNNFTGFYGLYDTYIFEQKNSFNIGIASALGLTYRLNNNLKIWLEVSNLSLSAFIKEEDVKSSTNLSVSSSVTKIMYSQSGLYNSSGTGTPTVPAYLQPFSNLSFNTGITYELHKSSQSLQTDPIR